MIQAKVDLKKELKNITIKPLLNAPKIPEGFFQSAWYSLQQAIGDIFANTKPKKSTEILYRLVGDISIIQMDEELYRVFNKELNKRIRERIDVLNLSCNEVDEKYLFLFDTFWKEYKEQVGKLRQIFLTLERAYMIKNSKCKSIWKLCMSLLDGATAEKPDILKKLLISLYSLIHKERLTGIKEDIRKMLRSGVEVLIELGHYRSEFEGSFIEQTRLFYEDESKQHIKNGDIKAYIAYMQTRIKDESDRVNCYLDLSTGPRLQTILETTLIKNHIETLIGHGFVSLAEEGAIAELGKLYEAIKKVNEIDSLKKAWSEYLQQKGTSMLKTEHNSEFIIEHLIKFKQKMDHVVETSFEKDPMFKFSLKIAFESFLNSNANQSAEFLAKYLDMYLNTDALKKVNKKGYEEIKQVIDSSMQIFKFILNKDIFEAFYLKRLCKRLLFHKLVSSDCEKYLLEKLREECGTGYTKKAEVMFQDMDVTQELFDKFSKFQNDLGRPKQPVQFLASILTLGSWPIESFVPIPLPKEIAIMQDSFEKYYVENNNKKSLQWSAPYSSATLSGMFDKEYIIEASGLQALILLLFNDKEVILYETIPALIGVHFDIKTDKSDKRKMVNENIESSVYSLLKTKLILSNGGEAPITNETKFYVNKTFTSVYKKIVVTRMSKKEKDQESKGTEEKVVEERKFEIQSAVMKIMKARKKCTHHDLFDALKSQLRFQFQPPAIKKEIETLIEKDYLKREEKNPNVYLYVS